MRHLIIIIAAMVSVSAAQEQLVMTYVPPAPTNAPAGVELVNIRDRNRDTNPRFFEVGERLRQFYPEVEYPILVCPPGHVISLVDGAVAPSEVGIEAARTNRLTVAQRRTLHDLVQIGTNFGLSARQVRQEPYRVLRVTLKNSETNTAAAATRQLARTVGLLEALKRTDEE